MIFRVICAWCGCTVSEETCSEAMSQLAQYPETNVIISHGMCETCKRRIEQNEFPNQGENENE